MPRTQINCPQCRQPLIADIQQLFDVGEDPKAKQIFLSGSFNFAQCSQCGYQGMLSSPLVYHDPEKELLLTFFPPDLALPITEQERVIGPLINRVVNNLPQEKRKGYLFNPRTMLTLQVMLETILEGDGITKEMIEAQQDRINLIQKLLSVSEQKRTEMIESEDEMIDDEFFGILARLMESAVLGQDETAAGKLNDLQNLLLENSTKGKALRGEADEIQAALKAVQELGEGITRENLLELILNAPTDTRLRAYVRLARPGMDYQFFQLLSERIERARSKGRPRLLGIREKLLEYTQELDEELANRREIAMKNLEAVIQTEDIRETLQQNIEAVDEFFVEAATQALTEARKSGDIGHSSRLQQILDVIDELSGPPIEIEIIEGLLKNADDENALKSAVESKGDEITTELVQILNTLITQTQTSLKQVQGEEGEKQTALLARLQAVNNAVLGFSMRRNFAGG